MSESKESLVIRLLRKMADLVYEYPRWFFYPQVILLAVCIFYTVDKLQFSASRNDLVGADKKYHQNFLKFKTEFPGQDDLVVVVESEDREKNRQFVERLGARLEAETNLFTDVFYKGDLAMMGSKALLFVDEKSLDELNKTLQEFLPFIQKFTAASNLYSLVKVVNRQFSGASREKNAQNDALIQGLPALERIITQADDCLQRPGSPPSPGMNALFGAGKEAENEMYITYGDGRIYLVTAHAIREKFNGDAVERMRVLAHQTQGEVPGINVGITGEPVLEHDEMAQSQIDTTVATIVSLVLVGLIFVYGYQETGRPLKATICLVVGLAYTMAFSTLAIGHLNILTITFLPMLVGMCIDFGVHLISRFEEELRKGNSQREAITKAMVYTGLGIYTGCFTTASAFLAMGITNFRGIQEMGIISGGGLLICLVPMLTLLPVLLLRGRQNVIDQSFARQVDQRARMEQVWLQRPGWTIAITGALCLLSIWKLPNVHFDYNLLNMQSDGLPAVITEKKLINSATNSVIFGVMIADSVQQAALLEAKLTNLSTVASVKSMSSFMAADATAKLAKIREIKKNIIDLPLPMIDAAPANLAALDSALLSLQGYLGLAIKEVKKENETALEGKLAGLRESVVSLRLRLLADKGDAAIAKITAYQKALFSDIHSTFATLKSQDDSGPLQIQDLPSALRNRFVGRSGKHLLQIFPKDDVWQRENQQKFVGQLRAIDPNVTGTPVQLLEYTTLLKNSYEEAACYATGAIIILVFIHFRRLICVVLSLLPVAIGALWMVGMMGWFHISFNPANIMTLPLVVGVGVTSGIHILNRYAEEHTPDILAKSTGLAVIVSALTTVAGFGSLVLAQHQGIRSLGLVMAIGTTTCMIAAITLLPAVMNLLTRWGWQVMKPSAENAHPTLDSEELNQSSTNAN